MVLHFLRVGVFIWDLNDKDKLPRLVGGGWVFRSRKESRREELTKALGRSDNGALWDHQHLTQFRPEDERGRTEWRARSEEISELKCPLYLGSYEICLVLINWVITFLKSLYLECLLCARKLKKIFFSLLLFWRDIDWMERKAGHNTLNGIASPSEAQDGNGSRVKDLDCFVQETFEVSKVLCFSSKKLWYAGGKGCHGSQ